MVPHNDWYGLDMRVPTPNIGAYALLLVKGRFSCDGASVTSALRHTLRDRLSGAR